VDGCPGANADTDDDDAGKQASRGRADDATQDDDAKSGECDEGSPKLFCGLRYLLGPRQSTFYSSPLSLGQT
jgi:hypothetical protein